MERAEIAKELREWANQTNYLITADPPDEEPLKICLLQAADALEEEERDARRYRALRSMSNVALSNLASMCAQYSVGLDAAIDAWIEEHQE